MATAWWVSIYVVTAGFLVWIAFGRGLKTMLGGLLAALFVEGVEPRSDRGIIPPCRGHNNSDVMPRGRRVPRPDCGRSPGHDGGGGAGDGGGNRPIAISADIPAVGILDRIEM